MSSDKEQSLTIETQSLNPADNVSEKEVETSGLTVEKRSRSKSPSIGGLLKYRLEQQMGRLQVLTELHDGLSEVLSDGDRDIITAKIVTLESLWTSFSTAHENIASSSPEFLNSSYAKDNVYMTAFRRYMKMLEALKFRALQLKHSSSHSNTHSTRDDHLPEIKIPKFDGNYSDWPQFRDLFKSMIIDSSLPSVKKMHYLKTSLVGSAQTLIVNIPTTGECFEEAWKTVEERYQNKRLLITTHVDRLLNLVPVSSRSSERLNEFISAVNESLTMLKLYGSPVEHWDHFLIPLLTKKLDSSLKEAWELKLGSSVEMPSLEDLSKFLTDRARALERIEASTHPKTSYSSATQKQSSSHSKTHHVSRPSLTQDRASSSSSSSSFNVRTTQRAGPLKPVHYPCDMCGEAHYIVTCPDFFKLTILKRRDVVAKKKLCVNCLGHHAVDACKQTRGCKHCGKLHHTMLHSLTHA